MKRVCFLVTYVYTPVSVIQTIRTTTYTRIWVVTRHQYRVSAHVSQASVGGETSGSVAKCRLFSKASIGKADLRPIFWPYKEEIVSEVFS